jgi:hypothetical protein
VHLKAMSSSLIESTDSKATNEAQLLQLVRRLFDIYRGDCLQGIDEPWAKDRAAHYCARVANTSRQYANQARRAQQLLLLETLTSLATERGMQV